MQYICIVSPENKQIVQRNIYIEMIAYAKCQRPTKNTWNVKHKSIAGK